MPRLSSHFQQRQPSPIRHAQILFKERADAGDVRCINLAIGNVSLPMHPAMMERLHHLDADGSPFKDGVCRYTHSAGTDEARQAFLHLIASCGADVSGLSCLVTDGGSQAMELMILGTCGPGSERPLMLLDPAYANYGDMARRCHVPVVSLTRHLGEDGSFTVGDLDALSRAIGLERPRALVVIPADNPTGSFLGLERLAAIARIAVEHDIWLVSDEAYRQLHYGGGPASSIWSLTEADVAGITGRRIGIETASKVWNACGLRIGALVTDSPSLHAKAVSEYTANLCANAIGQHVFGALAHVPHAELQGWYARQRDYYRTMMSEVVAGLREAVPGLIVSNPEASLYSVLDLHEIAPDFDGVSFVTHCAREGRVMLDGQAHTLLLAPMGGFYGKGGWGHLEGREPARTQLRLAYVESPEAMEIVPRLFAALLEQHRAQGAAS